MIDISVRKVSTDWSEMPSGLTWYFIGQPKTWKTSAVSKWSKDGADGVLLIATDLGADFADSANVVTATCLNPPVEPVKVDGKMVVDKNGQQKMKVIPPEKRGYSYRSGKKKGKPMAVYSLAEIYTWLSKSWEDLPYNVIAIDTVDEINKWIETIVCNELGIQAMGDGEWGADWGRARKKNVDLIVRLQKLVKKHGGDLILVSHAKQTQITDGKTQLSPELPRGLAYSLTAKADVIGYSTIDKEDGKAYVSFKSYDERAVGSRLKPLSQEKVLFEYESVRKQIITYKEK